MADFSSQIHAAVSAATPDAPSYSESAGSATSTPTPKATPIPDPPATPEPSSDFDDFSFPDEAAPEPEPIADANTPEPDQGKSSDRIMDDATRKAFMTDARGKKLYGGFQLGQALLKPPTEGGLGRIPSVDEIRDMSRKSADLDLMAHEFHNGNPQYAENFIKQWFEPRDQGNGQIGYSPGAQQAATKFMSTLDAMARDMNQPESYREAARQVYVKAALPVVSGQIEDMYARALAEPDLDTRLHLLNGARIWEHDIYGKMRELPPGIDAAEYAPGGRQTTATDPRSAELDGKLRYINQFEQNQQQQRQQAFQSAVSTQVNTAVNSDVEAALKSLKEALPERVFASYQNQFNQEIQGKLRADPEQLRAYRMAVDNARSNPTEQNIKAAADAMRSAVRPHIRQLRSQYLQDAKILITSSSDKRHSTLAEASQKTGTTSVAQPVGKDLSSALTRNAGESNTEYLRRTVRERVSAAS